MMQLRLVAGFDMHILAKIIAQIWVGRSGMQRIVVPAELPVSFINDLAVESAALKNPSGSPDYDYCVVISNNNLSLKSNEVVQLDEAEAFERRVGDRLFISRSGETLEKATYTSAVREVIAEGYPAMDIDGVDPRMHFSEVAEKAVVLIESDFGGKIDNSFNGQDQEETISWILTYLRDAYHKKGNMGTEWPVAWWLHVDQFFRSAWNVMAREDTLANTRIAEIMFQ